MDLTGASLQRSVRRVLPAASLLCWLYLYLVAWLLAWILVTFVLLGWTPVVVVSGSMSPRILAGDVVMLGEPREELATGHVITYDDPVRPGQLLTHRVDRVNEDGTYRTKGDANRVSDRAPVAHHDVIGVGRLLVPAIGLPVAWLTQERYLTIAAWALVTGLAGWFAVVPLEHRGARGARDGPTPHPRVRDAEVERC